MPEKLNTSVAVVGIDDVSAPGLPLLRLREDVGKLLHSPVLFRKGGGSSTRAYAGSGELIKSPCRRRRLQ